MSALATALGNYGPRHSFDFEGATYHLSYVDQAMKVAVENHLFERAAKALELTKSTMEPAEYAERLEKLRDDYEMGQYAFESPRCLKFLNEPVGMLKLASLILGVDDVLLMARMLAEKKDELLSKVQMVLKASLRVAPKAGGP